MQGRFKVFYPIYLDLRTRNVLIVGGGLIATGKVTGLLEAGARVTVIAPEVSAAIVQWHSESKLMWHAREFVESDIADQFIVIAVTDDKAPECAGVPVGECATARGKCRR